MIILERAPVTTGLITVLDNLGFPVGDNGSPTVPFGWQGETDAAGGTFIPWLSISPMGGSGSGEQDLSSLAGQAFWVLNYSLYMAGVNRTQCETLADRARAALCSLGVESIATVQGETAVWQIAGVACTSVGSNVQNTTAIPYYYVQSDNYQVRVTRAD